jgi:hydroxymethylpyrimidine pyrophosphatase-like HAD family hydrolase
MADVFLSFSTADQEHVEDVAKRLGERGITFYFAPKDGTIGEVLAKAIMRELKKCRVVFLFLSPAALQSGWVMIEQGAALGFGKRIFPILVGIEPEDLPDWLRGRRTIDIDKINKAIEEFKAEAVVIAGARNSRVLIFDIDGTVLAEDESFNDGRGKECLEVLLQLVQEGFRLIFITGNDYGKQHPRILRPLIERRVADAVFCFTDGGSRAFEFRSNVGNFVEIADYSRENLIASEVKQDILGEFHSALNSFFKDHESLRLPHMLPSSRTPDHLDVAIRPIRPSFFHSSKYGAFCDDLQQCFLSPLIRHTTFELLPKNVSYVLIVRSHGRTPQVDDDVAKLVNLVFRDILLRPMYKEISKPEAEVRGGDVVCQIALKPFNDDQLRREFREVMEQRLKAAGMAELSVLIGGRTTVDVQRHDVNKPKAIRFAVKEMKLDPSTAIYFGDEFVPFGNDLKVAQMKEGERPSLIVHVGNGQPPGDVRDRLIWDGNGPVGTLNYLKMLNFETSI